MYLITTTQNGYRFDYYVVCGSLGAWERWKLATIENYTARNWVLILNRPKEIRFAYGSPIRQTRGYQLRSVEVVE
jgi:hypothetical protein